MPKNVYLIKENHKKVEEVREIENEIPTYEEFLKTYEQENSVNYDDLTHEDISLSKGGFGPCSWANPDCTCYASQGFAPLRTVCPATGCSNRNVSGWFHSNNGRLLASDQPSCGTLLVSGRGYIKCANCGSGSDYSNWKFKCSGYGHPGYYNSTNVETFINALSFVSIDNPVNRNILRMLTMHLIDNC